MLKTHAIYHSCINICSRAKSCSTCRMPFLVHRPVDECQSVKDRQGMNYTKSCRECDQDTHGHLRCCCKITLWQLPKNSRHALWTDLSTSEHLQLPLKRNGAKADSWNLNTAFKIVPGLLREDGIRKKASERGDTWSVSLFPFSHVPFMNLKISFLLLLFLYFILFSIPNPTSPFLSHPFIAFPSSYLP